MIINKIYLKKTKTDFNNKELNQIKNCIDVMKGKPQVRLTVSQNVAPKKVSPVRNKFFANFFTKANSCKF